MSWLIGIGATALIAGGSLLAYPGNEGRHIAGLVLIIAGLTAAIELNRGK